MTIAPPKNRKPYAGSTMGVEQSKAQITKLLRDYGAEGVSWTDHFTSNAVELRFIVKNADGSGHGYKIIPAAFKEKHSTYDPVRGRNVSTEAPNWPRAMRLLFNWLKTKLESIAFGLTEVEEEFMAQMVVHDAQGRETTAGELVLPAIERGGGRLALDGTKEGQDIIEGDYR